MVFAAAGAVQAVGATASSLLQTRAWRIFNTDTGDVVFGAIEAEEITENVGANYAEAFSLTREDPVTMYLSSRTTTLSFRATLFNDSVLGYAGLYGAARLAASAFAERNAVRNALGAVAKLKRLKEWTKRHVFGTFRPPIVVFSAGDSEILQTSVIDSLSDIQYGPLGAFGEPKLITLTINLREYVPFDNVLATSPVPPPESRYHHVKRSFTTSLAVGVEASGEYMEQIAQREYGNALLGDILRKRHPKLQIPAIGDVVKVPSFEAIQTNTVVPTSIALKTLTLIPDSPQKTLRQTVLDRLNRPKNSSIVPEGL